MRLTFLGADHEVTGSCHFLQACGKNILIDCGMEQGNDVYENQELPVPASDVDYVLLTRRAGSKRSSARSPAWPSPASNR